MAEAGGVDDEGEKDAALQDKRQSAWRERERARAPLSLRPAAAPSRAPMSLSSPRAAYKRTGRTEIGSKLAARASRPTRPDETAKPKCSPFFFSTAERHSEIWRSSFHDFPCSKNNKTARPARWPTTPSTWSNRNLQNVRGGKRARGKEAPTTAGEGRVGSCHFARVLKRRKLDLDNPCSPLGKSIPFSKRPCSFYQKLARFFFFPSLLLELFFSSGKVNLP